MLLFHRDSRHALVTMFRLQSGAEMLRRKKHAMDRNESENVKYWNRLSEVDLTYP